MTLLPVQPERVPADLAALDRWVVWNLVTRDGNPTKEPAQAKQPHMRASSTDPATWATYDEALNCYFGAKADGVGFALGGGIAGVDLDDCRDVESGAITSWAQEIIAAIDSYTEISPTGTGVKIFLRGSLPAGGRRKGLIEFYDSGRYFTFTGHHLPGTPTTVEVRQEQLSAVHGRIFSASSATSTTATGSRVVSSFDLSDRDLLDRAERARNGDKFRRLFAGDCSDYPSRSEADLALCSHLAYWTNNDHGRMDRLFRQSGLMREKWDRRTGQQTYGDRTIETAIASCRDTYSGTRSSSMSSPAVQTNGVQLEDFHAYMPTHAYIFAPSRETWPATSVNARIAQVPVRNPDGTPALTDDGRPRRLKASEWLDQHRAVEQMTWIPGMPMLITDRLVSDGGWITRPGCTTFNLYRPPQVEPGDANAAGPWLEHVRKIYSADVDHILAWMAHRVQRPSEKINHALVMGGAQGIGKDTLIEPVKYAVGAWNFAEVSPTHLLGRFNGFVKSVILRVSEARDLGEVDRYAFYDHMKVYTAAPPDVLRVDEKHLREYSVWNVCGVIITTNHRTDGLYLPADDRRHYVAWSELTRDDFEGSYWTALYRWYANGGMRHVAAFLAAYDLSRFDPKAPPSKTPAFYDYVDANRAPEDAELADALDRLAVPGVSRGEPERPKALTLSELAGSVPSDFGDWLKDRKNARQIPHRMEAAGYVAVRNPTAKDGLWSVEKRRQVIYARHDLALRDRLAAASKLVADSERGTE